jgi:16S rRNA (uracil1498-N3)-methyltransferase
MGAPRFYHPAPVAAPSEVALAPEAAHHASRVLRLHVGDAVVLFNGEGGEYLGAIARIDKQGVFVSVREWIDVERESPLDVTLVQAVSSSDKMDLVLQKAVELGVRRIVVVQSARGVVRLDAARARKRLERWQQIIVGACEQCGRNRVPVLAPEVVPLRDWLPNLEEGTRRWLLAPDAEQRLRQTDRPQGEIQLLIGPEGGFTDDEYSTARAEGFTPIRLGPRVLRTETAALAALSAMQALWGDF